MPVGRFVGGPIGISIYVLNIRSYCPPRGRWWRVCAVDYAYFVGKVRKGKGFQADIILVMSVSQIG